MSCQHLQEADLQVDIVEASHQEEVEIDWFEGSTIQAEHELWHMDRALVDIAGCMYPRMDLGFEHTVLVRLSQR